MYHAPSLRHLVWHVTEQRAGQAVNVRCAADDHILANDIASRLRKAHPHVTYDVVQAPKQPKKDMSPGDWSRSRRR